QVEVRQQRIDAAELEAGSDEELCTAGRGGSARERLEHPRRRRADGEDALRRLDALPGLRRNLVALAMDPMLFEGRFADRPERVETDVEGDALDVEAREQLVCEVQAGRRCGGRAGVAGVHRLVALGILERRGDVRRQRCRAGRLAVEAWGPPALAEVVDVVDRPVAA